MRARLDLLICFATLAGTVSTGCTRENPAFDADATGTDDGGETIDPTSSEAEETPPETSDEETSMMCELAGGMEMVIKVPQPCGETNDTLDLYEHWFHVVEAGGSTWSVQFCNDLCETCEPLPGNLTLSPLQVADLAGPGACLLMAARRLGSGDDCDYHTVSIVEPGAANRVVVLARRTELLDLPSLDSSTGLMGFEPGLEIDQACDCALTPDSCCDGQAPTLYAYNVNGTVIPVGDMQTVFINQRSYDFWAFDAYQSGDCGAPIQVSWALTTKP